MTSTHDNQYSHSQVRRKRTRLRRLLIELCEQRRLLASDTVVSLDFTPDNVVGIATPAEFDQLFNEQWWATQSRRSDGHAFGTPNPGTNTTDLEMLRRFLDFKNDGQLNAPDAVLARKSIAVDFRQLFDSFSDDADLPLRVNVVANGSAKLQAARADNLLNQFVVYVGGNDFRTTNPDLGASAQAPQTKNNEFYSYAFAGEVANEMWSDSFKLTIQNRPSHYGFIDSKDFSQCLAGVIAHEAGQLLGLGPTANIKYSVLSSQRNPWLAGFPDRAYNASLLSSLEQQFTESQNPNREVIQSLDGSAPAPSTVAPANYQHAANTPATAKVSPWIFTEPTKSAPVSILGVVGSQTATSVAIALQSSYDQFQQSSFFGTIANRSNIASTTAPILVGSTNTALGLDGTDLSALLLKPGQARYSANGKLNLSGIADFAALRTRLEIAGFTVESAITDAQLSAGSTTDFVRFTRTYRLSELAGVAAFNPAIFELLLETSAITASGQLRFAADVEMYLTMGFDTGGGYVLTGKALESSITARGQIGGNLGPVGTTVGVANLDYASQVMLATENTDGRIRLADIASTHPSSVAGMATQTVTGATGVDLQFEATLGAAGTLKWKGGWWDINPNGLTPRPEMSGYDEDTLLDSLTRVKGNGLSQLKQKVPQIVSFLDKIPVFGPAAKTEAEKLLNDGLTFNEDEDLSDSFLEEDEYEFTFSLDPKALKDHLLKGIAPPQDLFEVRVNKPGTSQAFPLSGNGSLELGPPGAKFTTKVSGSGTAVASVKPDFYIGLDTLGGLYIVEGGKVNTTLVVNGTLAGSAALPSLIDGKFTSNAQFNAGMKFLIDDGDNITNERVYLAGEQWLSILGNEDFYSISGTIALTNTDLDAKIPEFALLPSLKLYGSAQYNLATRTGSFDVPPDAM